MNKPINPDLLLSNDFQRLSVGAKALYITLFCSADEYGFVDNVYRIIGINKYVSSNLNDLVSAGYLFAWGDTVLVADYFEHLGASVKINPLRTYDGTTVNNRTFRSLSVVNKCKHHKAFTPPTLDEVRAYAKERNSPVDPVAFYTYFNSPNEYGETWVNSKGKPVLSWKGTFVTWEKNSRLKGATNGRSNSWHSQPSSERNSQRVSERYNLVPTVDGRRKG